MCSGQGQQGGEAKAAKVRNWIGTYPEVTRGWWYRNVMLLCLSHGPWRPIIVTWKCLLGTPRPQCTEGILRETGGRRHRPFSSYVCSLFQKSFLSFVLSCSASLVLGWAVNGCVRVWVCGWSENLCIHLKIKHTCIKAYKAMLASNQVVGL